MGEIPGENLNREIDRQKQRPEDLVLEHVPPFVGDKKARPVRQVGVVVDGLAQDEGPSAGQQEGIRERDPPQTSTLASVVQALAAPPAGPCGWRIGTPGRA